MYPIEQENKYASMATYNLDDYSLDQGEGRFIALRVPSGFYLLPVCENTYPIHAYCFINTYLLHTFGSQRYIPFNRYTKYDFLHFDFEFKISYQLACLEGM